MIHAVEISFGIIAANAIEGTACIIIAVVLYWFYGGKT